MSGFGEVPSAARARDIIERIAESVINKIRPEPFLAKVYDINLNNQTARVLLAGETLNDLMTVRFALDKVPRSLMVDNTALGLSAPGDIVRIAGKPGGYYILDFFSGNPLGDKENAGGVSMNEDPSFDVIPWVNDYPSGWINFWDTDNTPSYFQEGADVLDGRYSLKIVRPNGSTIRVHGKNPFPVVAGDAITVSIWAKCAPTGGQLEFGFMTGTTVAMTEFFGGGGNQTVSQTISTVWAKYETTFTVPATHTLARVTFRLYTGLSTDMTFWVDNTFVKKAAFTPWISVNGSDYSGQPNLFINSWTNLGLGKQTAQYRKINDEVQIRGSISGGAIGNTAFVLPTGYRPPAILTYGTYTASTIVGVIDVLPGGDVRPTQGGSGDTNISMIRFSTL